MTTCIVGTSTSQMYLHQDKREETVPHHFTSFQDTSGCKGSISRFIPMGELLEKKYSLRREKMHTCIATGSLGLF